MSTVQLVRWLLPLLLLALLAGVLWSAWRIGVADGRSGLLGEQAADAQELQRETRALAGRTVERAHTTATQSIDKTFAALATEARRVQRAARPAVTAAVAPALTERAAVAAVATAALGADRADGVGAPCLDAAAVGVWNDAVAAYRALNRTAGGADGTVPAAAHAAAGIGDRGADRVGGGDAPVLALRSGARRPAELDAQPALSAGAIN